MISLAHPSILNQYLLNECPSACPEGIRDGISAGPCGVGRSKGGGPQRPLCPGASAGLGTGFQQPVLAALLPPFHPQAFLLMVHCSALDQMGAPGGQGPISSSLYPVPSLMLAQSRCSGVSHWRDEQGRVLEKPDRRVQP